MPKFESSTSQLFNNVRCSRPYASGEKYYYNKTYVGYPHQKYK